MKATRGRDELPCGCAVETDVEIHGDTVFITAERKFYCVTHDLRSRLAEAEGVMERQAKMLSEWQEHSEWCLFCDSQTDDDFNIHHDEGCAYEKITYTLEAYKSKHALKG